MTGKNSREDVRRLIQAELARTMSPLHNTALLKLIAPRLPESAVLTAKGLNTLLHDDPAGRFVRVGPGLWQLKTKMP